MSLENWRAYPGWEGYYEVSDQGRVRSLDRTIIASNGRSQFVKGRILSCPVDDQGYRRAILSRNDKATTRRVHVMVARTFLGERPAGMEVCHSDCDQLNNALSNLRYDTASNNHADTTKLGRWNPRPSRFTQQQQQQMKDLRAAGLTFQAIADNFGTVSSYVRKLVRRAA